MELEILLNFAGFSNQYFFAELWLPSDFQVAMVSVIIVANRA